MESCFLLFPHQLFQQPLPLPPGSRVWLVEEYLFFNQYAFHKQKLAYHRATMQYYADRLGAQGMQVQYIEAGSAHARVVTLVAHIASLAVQVIHAYRVHDNWLEKHILHAVRENGLSIHWHESPMFLLSHAEMKAEFEGMKTFFQTKFYIAQRKRLSILLDTSGAPQGGQWSFDADNRKPYPKGKTPPAAAGPAMTSFHEAAKVYVEKNYPDNPGTVDGPWIYPVTHHDAAAWLDDFIAHRLKDFGVYEDAMVAGEYLLHHSLLTPMLNIGLLTPDQVIDRVLAASASIPLNSLEGFVRQIIGWREFIRGVYHACGSRQRTTNYWGFSRKIPSAFYTATTGIAPVDDAIRKLLNTGYNHHIERLMILSNFMLLCEFDPDEVYRWFMEMYIDAYDWVMVPNVYGMGQFADGGLMCTKPYISGSNYILKMSNYKKDAAWTDIWDGLFWRFMHLHRDFFLKNPRLGMLVRTFDKMPDEKRQGHLNKAESFLAAIDLR